MSQCLEFTDRRHRDEKLGWSYIFNSLTTYQNAGLIWVFIFGVLSTVNLLDPPLAVQSALVNIFVYTTWGLLHLLAPPVVWLGMLIKHRASRTAGELTGWLLVWAGDSAVSLMAVGTAFSYAAAAETYPALTYAAMALFTAGLTIRDTEKVRTTCIATKRRVGAK